MSQLTHHNTDFEKRSFPIVLVCDNISMAANVGSLFRIADAFGVEKIYFCGSNLPEFNARMRKTARGTEKIVPFEVAEDISAVVTKLKHDDFSAISLEITTNSIPLHQFDFSKLKKIALILGDENYGVSSPILQNSEAIVHIEMFGNNSSMNVAQATAIALYEITKQSLSINK